VSANRVSLATAVETFPPHWAIPEFGFKLMKKVERFIKSVEIQVEKMLKNVEMQVEKC
jgi:hypothetical protein